MVGLQAIADHKKTVRRDENINFVFVASQIIFINIADMRANQAYYRLLSILFFLLSIPVYAQFNQALEEDSTITQFEKQIVYALADDSLCGRLAGTADEVASGKYIAGIFQSLKLKPLNGKLYQHSFRYTDENGAERQSSNILAMTGNRKAPAILVGAHYDHIGLGGNRSRNPTTSAVHNGADDNASGVALMLGLARMINLQKKGSCQIIFMAFGAHEPGLYGSDAAMKYCVENNIPVKAMINLDMVGRMDLESPTLFAGGDTVLIRTLKDALTPEPLITLKTKELPLGDHSAFESQNIPVLYLTTGMHDDYHKITDDAEMLNYEGMQTITRVLVSFIQTQSLKEMN